MSETFQEAVNALFGKYAFHPDCKAALVALTAAHEAEVAGLREDLVRADDDKRRLANLDAGEPESMKYLVNRFSAYAGSSSCIEGRFPDGDLMHETWGAIDQVQGYIAALTARAEAAEAELAARDRDHEAMEAMRLHVVTSVRRTNSGYDKEWVAENRNYKTRTASDPASAILAARDAAKKGGTP